MNRPVLTLLCGIPGCGKTTYAERLVTSTRVHISSDAIREELYGDANCQDNPERVFSIMKERAVKALYEGKSVLYDATNMTRKSRAAILNACPHFAKKEAIICYTPVDICVARDAERGRSVGRGVIMRMLKSFQFPYYDEGLDYIYVEYLHPITSADMQAVRDQMNIPHDNPHHTYDIAEHCKAAWRWAQDHNYPREVKLAAAIHDIGKPITKAFYDARGEATDIAHYYGHEGAGAWIACTVTTDVEVLWLISNHMGPFMNTKYYQNLPMHLKTAIDQLHDCDVNSH